MVRKARELRGLGKECVWQMSRMEGATAGGVLRRDVMDAAEVSFDTSYGENKVPVCSTEENPGKAAHLRPQPVQLWRDEGRAHRKTNRCDGQC